ncbi:MAG: hypothetical protein CMJ64_27395 [Planctomycetaceae bacterium]|nr:hypothetical protein [Planctomycetaceae bacterium]
MTTNPTVPRADDLNAAIDRVTKTYHAALQVQLSRLDRIMANVAGNYGLVYFKLQPLAELFIELQTALYRHVADQEELLFPPASSDSSRSNEKRTPATPSSPRSVTASRPTSTSRRYSTRFRS